MDFERVSLLLGIVHNSINVPGTERIRDEAIKELQQLNGIFTTVAAVEAAAEVVEEAPVAEVTAADAEQEEIKVGGRRI